MNCDLCLQPYCCWNNSDQQFCLLPGTHFFLVPRQLEALWSPTCSDARPFLHLSHPIPGCISTKEAQLQQREVTKVSVTCTLTTY